MVLIEGKLMKVLVSSFLFCSMFFAVFNQKPNEAHALFNQDDIEGEVISEVDKIIPTPQEVTYSQDFLEVYDGIDFNAAIMLGKNAPQGELDGAYFLQNAVERLIGKKIPILRYGNDYSSFKTIISVGTVQSNQLNQEIVTSHNISVPNNEEGYVIQKVSENVKKPNGNGKNKGDKGKAYKNFVVVAGKKNIGSYYGSTSLAQMFKKSEDRVLLREVSVRDWPDLNIRAIKDITTAEGHFTYDDGMDWMKFLSKTKINMFSLCYTHLTDKGWRNPTSEYLNAVKKMANYDRDKGIIQFQQEINPGFTGGLPTNDEEITELVNTYKLSLEAGASSILLAFDDQGSTNPSSHRQLANLIYSKLQDQYDFSMITVPQPYHFGYQNIATYLHEYTNKLNPNIDVVWTGNELWSHYTTPDHVNTWKGYTNPSNSKLPFYWHNDPVLQNTRLLADWKQTQYYFADRRVPFQGVALSSGEYIWESMPDYTSNGVIENIFRDTTAHKIYAIALADWMWNPDAYENTKTTFNRAKRYWDTLIANPALMKTASASSQFGYPYGPERAADGINSSDNTENVWATAPGEPTKNAWWKVDMGMTREINGVRIKYREYPDGAAYMVPKTVTIQVSEDNENWKTVVDKSDHVPLDGESYESNPYAYRFNTNARFIRLLFEDGGQNSLIELSEVQIIE